MRLQIPPATYGKLCTALAMIFGIESTIVAEDVLGISEKEARKAKSWAVQALVRAAIRDSSA